MTHPFQTSLARTAFVLIGVSVLTTVSVRGAEPREFANSLGMKLVRIAPGSFVMGQDGPAADYHMNKHPAKFDDADWDEKPAHRVTITQPFFMAETEVTLGQYRAFDPDFRKDDRDADAALNGISWTQAVAFCEWLSKNEGWTYRLPTEAECSSCSPARTTTCSTWRG